MNDGGQLGSEHRNCEGSSHNVGSDSRCIFETASQWTHFPLAEQDSSLGRIQDGVTLMQAQGFISEDEMIDMGMPPLCTDHRTDLALSRRR